jgi:hypothetical protein
MVGLTALIVSRTASDEARTTAAIAPEADTDSPRAGESSSVFGPVAVDMPSEEAAAVLAAEPELRPADLRAAVRDWVSEWPAWAARRKREIRARIERGEEDSLVNLLLFGTSFTALPRVTPEELVRTEGAEGSERLVSGRLADLVAGAVAPGANERLQLVREVLSRHGIDPTLPAGRDAARAYLVRQLEQVLEANARNRTLRRQAQATRDLRAELAAYGAFYRSRGLSTDTNLLASFAIEDALAAFASSGRLGAGSIHRVAVIGPGLDISDKAEGHDFYPIQTIQPFALVDSLLRAGVSTLEDLQVTTFDVSARVNRHITAARERARRGDDYILQLPLAPSRATRTWRRELEQYWSRFGDRIGAEVPALRVPAHAGTVRVRAVRVRPEVTLGIVAHDLNIVFERLSPLALDDRFDLMIATNVLVYYDAADQALALANIAAMLRPGGYLLTNTLIRQSASMAVLDDDIRRVDFDSQDGGDTILWYRRQ